MSIKAIETRYKGYRFRSRLEARWAVFMDEIGAKWQYEPEGFVLDGRPYLPDFWIPLSDPLEIRPYPRGIPPQPGLYMEIKPVRLTQDEEKLCRLLAVHTGHCVYAAAGNLGLGEFISYKWHPLYPQNVQRQEKLDEMGLNSLLFYLAAECGYHDSRCLARIKPALNAARSARFEHGENGAPRKKTRHWPGSALTVCNRCERVIESLFSPCSFCDKPLIYGQCNGCGENVTDRNFGFGYDEGVYCATCENAIHTTTE